MSLLYSRKFSFASWSNLKIIFSSVGCSYVCLTLSCYFFYNHWMCHVYYFYFYVVFLSVQFFFILVFWKVYISSLAIAFCLPLIVPLFLLLSILLSGLPVLNGILSFLLNNSQWLLSFSLLSVFQLQCLYFVRIYNVYKLFLLPSF